MNDRWEQELAVAVIKQAAEDLQGENGVADQEDAQDFFKPEEMKDSWLEFWCMVAGVNPRAVSERAENMGRFYRYRGDYDDV